MTKLEFRDIPDLSLVVLIKNEIHKAKGEHVDMVAGSLMDMSKQPSPGIFGETERPSAEFTQYQENMQKVMYLVTMEESLDNIIEWFKGRISGKEV